MELKLSTTEELKNIIKKDYGSEISNEQVKNLGVILLRLTKLSVTALARVDEKNSSIQARCGISRVN